MSVIESAKKQQAKKGQKATVAAGQSMLDENFPDRYELLRDENTHLKKAHKELEEQIKLIAIKLKR